MNILERFENAKEFVQEQLNIKNEHMIDEIAWKFILGDVILDIADQAGFKGLEPGKDIKIFLGDGANLQDIMIGTSLCILVRSAYSEDKSSESQPNPDNISGPGL